MTELRYAFGQNWQQFVDQKLSEAVVGESIRHMGNFFRSPSLAGKTFLDIGCGSGIHSLAALRLGAERVVSFDYDENSVITTRRVRDWAGFPEDRWEIFQGSVLDLDLMQTIGKFDIVYSWGVLHHTGAMWDAVRAAMIPLKPGGEFYIALYSSENYADPPPEFWIRLKRAYNNANPLTRKLMEMKYANVAVIRGQPVARLGEYGGRGMTLWTDVKDWLGGYPIEFASLPETRAFCEKEGQLDLVNLKTGEGCSEYLFTRLDSSAKWREIEADRGRHIMSGPFHHREGFLHEFGAPHLASTADNERERARSKVMIFEDGKPLGLAHSQHTEIAKRGGGRFSHWNESLMFSASDNTSPLRNGRSYAYCEAYWA
jgi:2-polyprenyl-3-methyl-5-hydroxy-6-metoxy-1,4-benzoquinol methylase